MGETTLRPVVFDGLTASHVHDAKNKLQVTDRQTEQSELKYCAIHIISKLFNGKAIYLSIF